MTDTNINITEIINETLDKMATDAETIREMARHMEARDRSQQVLKSTLAKKCNEFAYELSYCRNQVEQLSQYDCRIDLRSCHTDLKLCGEVLFRNPSWTSEMILLQSFLRLINWPFVICYQPGSSLNKFLLARFSYSTTATVKLLMFSILALTWFIFLVKFMQKLLEWRRELLDYRQNEEDNRPWWQKFRGGSRSFDPTCICHLLAELDPALLEVELEKTLRSLEQQIKENPQSYPDKKIEKNFQSNTKNKINKISQAKKLRKREKLKRFILKIVIGATTLLGPSYKLDRQFLKPVPVRLMPTLKPAPVLFSIDDNQEGHMDNTGMNLPTVIKNNLSKNNTEQSDSSLRIITGNGHLLEISYPTVELETLDPIIQEILLPEKYIVEMEQIAMPLSPISENEDPVNKLDSLENKENKLKQIRRKST